jgi:endonuclease/exonuclease/phosphatase (EEP) superfamily protein YafD
VLRRLLSFLLLLAIAAALFVLLAPQSVGLQRHAYIAQAIAFRGVLLVAAVAIAIVFVFAGIVIRPLRRFLAAAAVLLIVFAAATGGVLFERGLGSTAFATRQTGDVTVLSWNTRGGAPGAARIAALALAVHADVVSLPETRNVTAEQVAAILKRSGVSMSVLTLAYDQVSAAHSTSLIISSRLGDYSMSTDQTTTRILPTVVATPRDGSGPVLIAAHAVAPEPGYLDDWRFDLGYLARVCSGNDVIMAGDFNSTLDHQSGLGTRSATLGDCRDAALATGNAAVGTWPTSVPSLLSTPIDHVMTTPDWKVSGMRVITTEDGTGSDHRPIVAQLTPKTS